MSLNFRTILICIGISLILSSHQLNAQILKDTATLNLIRKDVDYVYNLEFDNARAVYSEIKKKYPDHPIVSLIRGITTYWENYPLLPAGASHELFEEDMKQCIKLSEININSENEAEYLLANLCARGMLLTFYSDNDLITEVIPMAVSSYKYLRKSFDYTSSCSDLYYFTGLYNYYREAYPEEYPVYKSFALLFPPGGMDTGLKEIQTTARRAVVLGPESYYLLTWIYLNFENNYPAGSSYSKSLNEKYPDNALYRATYIKNLLLLKQYDDAEKLMNVSTEEEMNRYYRAQIIIFSGIIQEKKYGNKEVASQYYNKGIDQISYAGEYGYEYAAYCYYGLSRISEAKGEDQAAKIFRTQAKKLAKFRNITFDK